jgi:galactokinase
MATRVLPPASSATVLDADRLVDRLADLAPQALAGRSSVRLVRAPGRVNLIGEHTDYNDGFVLPVAIGLETWIAYVPSDDGRVTVTLDGSGETMSFELDGIEPRRGAWIDYVAGTAWAQAKARLDTSGWRGVVAATLPQEAGLSSSASLELAAAWALSGWQPPATEPLTLARICQRAENEYVGVRCGLMDQFAVACGEPDRALLLDCRAFEYDAVPLPRGELTLVAINTGSPRRLGTSAYNARRAECESAVRALAQRRPEVRALRDVEVEDLEWAEGVLDDVSFRRCRHVVTENARVLATVGALAAGDLEALGRLFAESHASLRDDYEVSSPELDLLVEIAARTPGVVAARMTGGGFGGCTVNLVRPDAVERLMDAVLREYPRATGLTPTVFPLEAVAGAGPVDPARAG